MAVGISGWVADYSLARPGAAALKAAGASGVMRYLFPGRTDGANIQLGEIADFNVHGLPYGLVMEADAKWLLRGYDAGKTIGAEALQLEHSLGIPPGVIHLAADWNIQPPEYATALSTMQGVSDGGYGPANIRPYGSKDWCDWVQANSDFRGSWSAFAWSQNPDGSFAHAVDARLWQYNYWPAGVPVVAGCDYNQVLGDWAPRTTSTDWFDMVTVTDLENAVRTVLNEGTAAGQQNWATTNKALLATCQGLANTAKTLAGALSIAISGGNGHKGLDQLAVMLEDLGANPGTVETSTLEAAVTSAVTAALKDMTLKVA